MGAMQMSMQMRDLDANEPGWKCAMSGMERGGGYANEMVMRGMGVGGGIWGNLWEFFGGFWGIFDVILGFLGGILGGILG